jgi:hypothetical protein
MSRRHRLALVAWSAAVLAGWPDRPGIAESIPLACSADRPSVAIGEAVALRAWAVQASGQRLTYTWAAMAGQIEGRGAEARWSLADLRPGTYAATVNVGGADGAPGECVLRVIVRRDVESRGPSRETGRSLLLPGRAEDAGYGLYSYVLLGSPPGDAARDRYLKALDAFVTLIPDVASLEEYVQREQLNVAYLPVRATPDRPPSAPWALENYDYARARAILRNVTRPNREGPYLLAALRPLTSASTTGPYLFQDLSAVPPQLAATWVKEFLNQAAQQRFWEERKGAQLATRMRVTIGILGAGLPEVRKSVDDWIAWVH